MNETGNRRPLKMRSWKIIQSGARWLSRKDVTPNQISLASIGFSALTGICLATLPLYSHGFTAFLALIAGLGIVGRGLCNIFDGMVAVEGGKATRSGEIFNDVPDRISDVFILVGLGYATAFSWTPAAGWLAAILAVMTAYARTLGRSLGAPTDFQGPMSKTYRMAVVAAACAITALWPQDYIFALALVVIIIGSAITVCNRVRDAYIFLENRPDA